MEKIFHLERNDNDLVASALISSVRRTEIKHLSSTRKYQLGVIIVMLVLWLILKFSGDTPDSSEFVLCMIVMSYIYIDLRIKILKIFERMESRAKTNGEQ